MAISRMTSTLAALTIAGGTLVSGASAATADAADAKTSTADRASSYSAEECASATTIEVRFDDSPSEVYFLDTATGAVTDETTTKYSGCDEDAAVEGDTFSAQAVEAYGLAQLTRADPNYFASDLNGSFNIQATHTTGYPVAWSMTLTPAARAIATGPVTARVDRNPPNCSYSKVAAVPDYFFHSSCRGHTAEAVYVLNGVYTYPCQVAGRTCDAELIWNARYRIIP